LADIYPAKFVKRPQIHSFNRSKEQSRDNKDLNCASQAAREVVDSQAVPQQNSALFSAAVNRRPRPPVPGRSPSGRCAVEWWKSAEKETAPPKGRAVQND